MVTQSALQQAASTISTTGPVKHEASPRRIRVQLGGSIIFDTTESRLVWEHPYYPQYYLPVSSLSSNALLHPERKHGEGKSKCSICDIEVNGMLFKDAALLVESGPLERFVRPVLSMMEAFFEEDDPIRGHPVDPYKRVDVRRSSRPIKVEVAGKVVAEADWAVHLYETSLPVRYYLPRTAVKLGMLRPSSTSSYCPYKGHSSYYDIIPEEGAEPVKDIVWYYETPLLAVEAIRDLVCFYNEKVDITLDGTKLERPKTHFS